MPPLIGFSDNPFKSRTDFIQGAIALLHPLEKYKSARKARIKLATSTGAGFSETAAQLEGFARPLWAVADLLRLKHEELELLQVEPDLDLESWLSGLRNGVDPTSSEYWGDLGDFDQRMVEMESIAYALLASPSQFGFRGDERTRTNLINWLRQINGRKMPLNNWRWFRVFVNLALVRTLEVPLDEVKHIIDQELATLDSFYLGEGWSSDGPWGEERRQADYYSGSFAIQFAQLLYVRFAADLDPERAARYKLQAASFGSEFWRFFDREGAAIPFGRSLTYRFAFAAFWSSAAAAKVTIDPPMENLGTVKGMLLRHLRWWTRQPHIFHTDGSLNIGFTYSNMYMSEDYNSPQSVYWCLKPFIALSISKDDEFWTSEELPHPLDIGDSLERLPLHASLSAPKQVLCNTNEHTFLLSSGQFTSKNHKAREAKYGKFAYSSNFGFSVSTGPLLEQVAPDSVLCLSRDAGETWKTHWDPFDIRQVSITHMGETLPGLCSKWKPWKDVDLMIRTTLVPPSKHWPAWHIRLHEFSFDAASRKQLRQLVCVDGGFAISDELPIGSSLYETACNTISQTDGIKSLGLWADRSVGCLALSNGGASGVLDITQEFTNHAVTGPGRDFSSDKATSLVSHVMFIKPDANTNLIASRTMIPATQHEINLRTTEEERNSSEDQAGVRLIVRLVIAVFAVAPSSPSDFNRTLGMWRDFPSRIAPVKDALSGLAFSQ